ncbi:hypothetical protein [Nocardia sp. bgisy134]|uniref:hypothetical protein n=1 Tax=unclassified Nocardia TaxID=2637762 RepID=UPI003D7534BE
MTRSSLLYLLLGNRFHTVDLVTAEQREMKRWSGAGLAGLMAATSLWGCCSAGLALLGSQRAAPLVALGAAVPLLVVAVAGGRRPWRELRANPGTYLRLGFLEAANISMYVAALAIGPVGVVVALHLASPILLLAGAVMSGARKLSTPIVIEAGLLVAAVAVVSMRPGIETSTTAALLGCVLALGSAAAVTALIILVARESRRGDPIVSAGLQLAVAGLLTTPLLVTTATGSWQHMAIEVSLGAALLGPGFAAYWYGIAHLSAPTAGVLGLNEAVVAASVVAAVDSSRISVQTIAAGALVAAAVVLDTVWGVEIREE